MNVELALPCSEVCFFGVCQRCVKYFQKYLDPSTSTFKSTCIQVQVLWVFSKCTWVQVQVLLKVLGYKYFQVLSTNNDHDHENNNI